MEKDKTKREYGKTCFCIGPDKCTNKDCPLVKQYTERRLR